MSYDIRTKQPRLDADRRAQVIADLGRLPGIDAELPVPASSAPARLLHVGDRITLRFPGSSIPAPLEITGRTATRWTARPTIAQPCAMVGYRPGSTILLPLDILQRPGVFRVRIR
jgi:hypothetical protein